MNIYKIWQDVNINNDAFRSAVVIAENEEKAKLIYPVTYEKNVLHIKDCNKVYGAWAVNAKDVYIKLLGVADKKYTREAVIIAS